jgi:uncharacterized protein
MQSQGMPRPIDPTQLVMSERHGIEIDYCPTCRGIWLDRGELDKILERAPSAIPPAQAYRATPYAPQPHGYGNYEHKRRKSFLEELFD